MATPNIWIFSLEPLDSRYTKQWHTNIPEILSAAAGDRFNVRQIDGVQRTAKVTNGAFLNFSDTNYWKSTQLCNFVELLDAGETTPNDKFLFTDAWNPCITQVAYMRDLLDQQWELHGIWHAGAYDPSDILGYKMEKPWPWEAEKSWFYSLDYNYYASNFHKDMFLKNLEIPSQYHNKAVRSGQPHGEIIQSMKKYSGTRKSNEKLIMWPHRFNDDKQPDIAVDLGKQYNMVITQKMSLTKDEYYETLAKSTVMFSCALHENLGISVMEGVLAGVIPVLPDRCSYKEMYLPQFKYPSEWTESYAAYQHHKGDLINFINHRLQNRDQYMHLLQDQCDILMEEYLTAKVMVNKITGLDSAT